MDIREKEEAAAEAVLGEKDPRDVLVDLTSTNSERKAAETVLGLDIPDSAEIGPTSVE